MGELNSKKIVFLDRDGVINKKAYEHCYITKVEDFIFNEGIFDICSNFKERGFEFIVITNQRGVARGLYGEEKLHEIHNYMKKEFYNNEIEILDILYCPHENNTCNCRKPKDGLLKKACRKYDIDIHNSILISDSRSDISMGDKFGIGKNIFIESDNLKDILL